MKMKSHPGIYIYISYHIQFDLEGAKSNIFDKVFLKKLMMIFIYKIIFFVNFHPLNLLKYLYFIFINLCSLTTQIIISF